MALHLKTSKLLFKEAKNMLHLASVLHLKTSKLLFKCSIISAPVFKGIFKNFQVTIQAACYIYQSLY
mgnify:CR=1 FL=1